MELMFRLMAEEREVCKIMNPFVSIWIKPKETIDRLKDSVWVNRVGLLPYLAAGINGVAESNVNPLFVKLDLQDSFLRIIVVVGLVIIASMIIRVIYVNLIFIVGKSLEGQATKRNIDTVLSLTMIPEFFKLTYLTIVWVNGASIDNFEPSDTLYFICSVLSIIIAIIGLRHVQKFAYKYVLLNIFMPMVLFALLVFLIL
jgi:hypothetical protein